MDKHNRFLQTVCKARTYVSLNTYGASQRPQVTHDMIRWNMTGVLGNNIRESCADNEEVCGGLQLQAKGFSF